MGLEYARQLAASGCGVVMVSNQQQELEQCAVELKTAYSAKIWPVYCDLARNESADELFAICQEKGLQIDILINNAGMFFFKELKDEVCEAGDKMLFLHVITPTRLCERFAEGMKQRGRGYILNVSSVAAGMHVPGLVMYSATKSYLRSFSKSWYYEMKFYGVSVTAVCPGAVSTGLYKVLPTLVKILAIAGKFGLVYSPQKLVRKALKAMFRRRRCVTPGWFNLLFAPAVNALPKRLVSRIWRELNVEDS
jgi:short-subunit dehydrogenase